MYWHCDIECSPKIMHQKVLQVRAHEEDRGVSTVEQFTIDDTQVLLPEVLRTIFEFYNRF